MAPPKKRGRPPKTTTTRRSPSPPFLPVFSRPKACPKVPSRRHIEDLDDDDDPAGAFFDFSPAVNAGGAVPIPATAGPSSKVCLFCLVILIAIANSFQAAGKSRAVQMAESGVAPCPLADIDFFTGPASGPESEDEMMAEVCNYSI
jgi:hypothetical protein